MHNRNNKKWLFWWEYWKLISTESGNGENNGVSSVETVEKSANDVIWLTITTDDSLTEDVPMYAFHVVQSESPRERNFSNFHKFEKKYDGYNSDGEMGL